MAKYKRYYDFLFFYGTDIYTSLIRKIECKKPDAEKIPTSGFTSSVMLAWLSQSGVLRPAVPGYICQELPTCLRIEVIEPL